MRYPKDHKPQARVAILHSAARILKENGYDGVGVDAIAASANVTSGALYSHFENKEAILQEVIAVQLGDEFAAIADDDPAQRRARLGQVLRMYLSGEHRQDPAAGCVMPSLSADVARAGDQVRATYQTGMKRLVATLAPAMPGTPSEQEQQAWTLVASIVGAVMIARALPAGDEAQAVLDATLDTALATIDQKS